MTQIIFPLIIGFLLLGAMVYWFLQEDRSHKIELWEARDALGQLRSNFLPANLVDRIFDDRDFVFVRKQKEPGVARLLEAERKAIAIYWLCHTRRQIRRLMSFYVKSARHSARLSVALELRMAFRYFAFLASCNALLGLIWLRGPFHARQVARRTVAVATRFYTASERLLTLAEARYARLPEVSGPERPAA